MKIPRTIFVLAAVIIIIVAGLVAYSLLQPPATSCTTTWLCAAHYPVQVAGNYGVAGQSCVTNSTTIYCVGGIDANGGPRDVVLVGSATPSGNITGWTLQTNSYPQDVSGESCVANGGYVYCVGGIRDDAGDDVASSYFAQYSGANVGAWKSSTPYPVPIDSESCAANGSLIYCVGGNNETGGTTSTGASSDSVWFAHLSGSGIGNWTRSTSYPSSVFDPSCFGSGGYLYCLGGADSSGNPVSTSYYAVLSPGGVGEWIKTTPYGVAAVGISCAFGGGNIYCVGGETSGGQSPVFASSTYWAPISSGGIGTWKMSQAYPDTVGTTCVVASAYMYCIGGFDQGSTGISDVVNFANTNTLSG